MVAFRNFSAESIRLQGAPKLKISSVQYTTAYNQMGTNANKYNVEFYPITHFPTEVSQVFLIIGALNTRFHYQIISRGVKHVLFTR